MKRIYDVSAKANDNLEKLCDALVELNAYRFHAQDDGWSVKFAIHGETGDVTVKIERADWPTLEDDAEN